MNGGFNARGTTFVSQHITFLLVLFVRYLGSGLILNCGLLVLPTYGDRRTHRQFETDLGYDTVIFSSRRQDVFCETSLFRNGASEDSSLLLCYSTQTSKLVLTFKGGFFFAFIFWV